MNATGLTRDQIDALLADVTPMLGYLTRLSDRMDKRGNRSPIWCGKHSTRCKSCE
jgi:hypothetical protein